MSHIVEARTKIQNPDAALLRQALEIVAGAHEGGHVEQHILRGEKHFIFDLTAVHHMDSAVIGQIVKSHSSLLKSGGKLRIAGASGMVDGVLRMTHVHKVIEIYPTVAEASKNFPQES